MAPLATPRRQPKQSKLDFLSAAKNASAKTPNGKKTSANGNGNILSFFKKVDVEEQLFIATSSDPTIEIEQTPSKRRKLSHDDTSISVPVVEPTISPTTTRSDPTGLDAKKKPTRGKGPFLPDSDSEDDDIDETESPKAKTHPIEDSEKLSPEIPTLPTDESCPGPPELTSAQSDVDDQFMDFDDMEGLFDDDELEVGEEFRERRFMEQQARLEAQEAGIFLSDDMIDDPPDGDSMTQACPVCNSSLDGVTSEQATVHVNACLDGTPIAPQVSAKHQPADAAEVANALDAPDISKRFARAAVPRPGQANPIGLEQSPNKAASAFSKLMSGHAEDAAWASAAASEHASRGKQAYQRTCPFYKIMPGFFICVDAFRYGAVKGCKAYFLSHFHSDHYIGLTANWSHGPIYCSKVTGSLIKSQLRTAGKYVKEIEFEEKFEVPGTEGVMVTMIPANHCPGSSLFLFEKRIGTGPSLKTQRILHCGDFRACPAHVKHPLLKPDVIDAISGKAKQQRIDICYLDTTYLNPRYSFPPQNDVIQACADFCKSIAGDPSVANDTFDSLKREKGTAAVSQYFSKETSTTRSTDRDADSTNSEKANAKNRLLVVCGTYSIGKERICKAIAQALGTKIFASASKIKICSQLGDPELTALMTSDPREAQVHMQMLMEIRAETLQDYLDSYKPHFTRIVGFRPSGWNFRSPTTTAKNVPANTSPGSVPTTSILHGDAWRTRFGSSDFVPQRGSTREAMCFGVPYSEHSSFRELALFCMALRIEKVVPTVNVGSDVSRKRMKGWTDRWIAERRKGGIMKIEEEHDDNIEQDVKGQAVLWDGKNSKGGYAVW
ncbi:DRMBL-domain-containing protein [Xylariaceae sp. FL0255]|nr:DRMBL-domain-containing protein [Xylariaceae sp. FL0255]